MHQHRDLAVGENLDRLAAEHERGDAVAAVRRHDDEIAAFQLSNIDDRLIRMLMFDTTACLWTKPTGRARSTRNSGPS